MPLHVHTPLDQTSLWRTKFEQKSAPRRFTQWIDSVPCKIWQQLISASLKELVEQITLGTILKIEEKISKVSLGIQSSSTFQCLYEETNGEKGWESKDERMRVPLNEAWRWALLPIWYYFAWSAKEHYGKSHKQNLWGKRTNKEKSARGTCKFM